MIIKAIIFDLDGTLANTLADVSICMNKALLKYGFFEHEQNKYCFFMGKGVTDMVRDAIPKEKRSEKSVNDVKKEYEVLYNEHFLDNTKPFDGIIELLNELKKMKIKCAVLSNKPNNFTKRIADELFKDFKFDLVWGDREGVPIKPNPASSLFIAESFGVLPHEMMFVGDSDVDMQTAKNSGMYGVGALWGFRTKEELLNNGADYVIEHPSELLDIIDKEKIQ